MENDNQNNTQSTLIQNQLQCLQNICSLTIDHITNNEEINTKNKKKLQSKMERILYRSLWTISKDIIPQLQTAHKNKPSSKSPQTIQKQIKDMIQTYILTRSDIKQNDIIAYMNKKQEYEIFIPTLEATDKNDITTSNTDNITLQQDVPSMTNTHKQLNIPYTNDPNDNHTKIRKIGNIPSSDPDYKWWINNHAYKAQQAHLNNHSHSIQQNISA